MSQPPRSSVTWSALRIAASLSIVVALACDGFAHRSPWTIGLAVPALTILCAIGRRNASAAASRHLKPGRKSAVALRMALRQILIGGAGYLIGMGFGAMLAPADRVAPLSELDLWTACVFLVLATGLGVLDSWLNESEVDETSASTRMAPRQPLSAGRGAAREDDNRAPGQR